MPEGQEIKDLYNKLYDIKAYTRSFEDFYAKYGTDEGANDLYNKLSKQDYKGAKLVTIDQDAFKGKYYTHLKKKDESVSAGQSISR